MIKKLAFPLLVLLTDILSILHQDNETSLLKQSLLFHTPLYVAISVDTQPESSHYSRSIDRWTNQDHLNHRAGPRNYVQLSSNSHKTRYASLILHAEAKGVAGLGKAGGDGTAGSDKAGQQVPPEVYIALTYAGTAFLFTLSVPLILYGFNKLLNKIEDCFGCGPASRKTASTVSNSSDSAESENKRKIHRETNSSDHNHIQSAKVSHKHQKNEFDKASRGEIKNTQSVCKKPSQASSKQMSIHLISGLTLNNGPYSANSPDIEEANHSDRVCGLSVADEEPVARKDSSLHTISGYGQPTFSQSFKPPGSVVRNWHKNDQSLPKLAAASDADYRAHMVGQNFNPTGIGMSRS